MAKLVSNFSLASRETWKLEYNLGWKWHIWIDCFCSDFYTIGVASHHAGHAVWISNLSQCLEHTMRAQTHTHTQSGHTGPESSSCMWDEVSDDTPLFTYTSDFSVHFTGRRRVYGHRIQMICKTINAALWQTSGFIRDTAWTGPRRTLETQLPFTGFSLVCRLLKLRVVIVRSDMDSNNKYILRFHCLYEYLCQRWHWHGRLYFVQVTTKIADQRNTTRRDTTSKSRRINSKTPYKMVIYWQKENTICALGHKHHRIAIEYQKTHIEYCRWLRTIRVSRVNPECRMEEKRERKYHYRHWQYVLESLEQPKSTVENHLFR